MSDGPSGRDDRVDLGDDIADAALAGVPGSAWPAYLASFAAALETEPGRWRGGEVVEVNDAGEPVRQLPWFQLSESLGELVRQSYDLGLIVGFDWSSWAAAWEDRDGGVASARDAVKLLTTIVRADRFAEGTIAGAHRDGRLRSVYERLTSAYGGGADAHETATT